MQKRVLALLLVVVMVFSLLPVTAVTAEGETTEGYTMILQKAHSQDADTLTVDVYLQANLADQGDVTSFEFAVTPADGLGVAVPTTPLNGEYLESAGPVTDETTGEVTDPSTRIVYSSETPADAAFAVGTSRVLVASFSMTGFNKTLTVPDDYRDAFEISNYKVINLDTTEDAQPTTELKELSYSCSGHDCGHNAATTWTPLTAAQLADGETLNAGNYYLTEDVTITGEISVAANAAVMFCLNGYDIHAAAPEDSTSITRMFVLGNDGSVLNLCDCTATGSGVDYEAGTLYPNRNWGGAIRIDKTGTVNMFGGVIDGGDTIPKEGGAAVYAKAGATLNILGGLFKNLTAEVSETMNYGPIEVRGAECNVTIANATFVGCGQYIVTDSYTAGANVTMKDVTVTGSQKGATAANMNANMNSLTLEGNCQFDAPVYIKSGKAVSLNLGSQANVTLVTAEEMTAENFTAVNSGAAFSAGTVFYENAGEYLALEDGKIAFSSHAHDNVSFKPWRATDSLPTEGSWYLDKDVTLTDAVTVSKEVNLDLNGKTVTQTTAGARLFYITGGVLNLYDCQGTGTLTGGTHATGSCVNVARPGSVFNMYGGKISGNQAASGNNSAAVYIQATTDAGAAGTFNMYGGEICNNTGLRYGSAVTVGGTDAKFYMEGGKIHQNTVKNTATNTNQGDGTIYVYANAVFEMKGGEICDNTAERGGGVYATGATVTITGGSFSNNTAHANKSAASGQHTGTGGAIYLNDTTATVTGVAFTGNKAEKGSVSSTNDLGTGGAIYCRDASVVTVTNCTFTGNRCDGTGGSVLENRNSNTITVKDSVLTGNTGAMTIYSNSGSTKLIFDGAQITGNSITSGYGAVYINTATHTVTAKGATVIAANTSTTVTAANRDLYMGGVTAGKPLITVDGLSKGAHINVYCVSTAYNTENLVASTVVSKTESQSVDDWSCGYITYYNAKTDAGRNVSYVNDAFVFGHYHAGIAGEFQEWTEADSLPSEAGNWYLANDVSLSAENTTADTGVADYKLCLNGHTISRASGSSRAFRSYASNTVVTDCTAGYDKDGYLIPGTGGTFSGFQASSAGAAIYANVAGGTVQVSGITFNNIKNTASTYGADARKGFGGGAIGVRGDASTKLTVDGCRFIGCSSTTGGGAITTRLGTDMEIKNSVFENNSAGHSGGAICTYAVADTARAEVTLFNCYFAGNHATTRMTASGGTTVDTSSGRGGAVYGVYADITATDCTFEDNYVASEDSDATQGGAIYAADNTNLVISNSSFSGNHANQYAGAIYFQGTSGYTATIDGGWFENNSVIHGDGSVIYTKDSGAKLDITGTATNPVVFKNNVANPTTTNGSGRAALYLPNANATVKYANFIGNQGLRAGAIYMNGGSATFENSNFEGNNATLDGGVLQLYGGSATFTSCSFTGNSANRGAVFCSGNSTATRNILFDGCIATGNEARNSAAFAYIFQTCETTLKDTTIKNNKSEENGVIVNAATEEGVVQGNTYVEGSTYIYDNIKTSTGQQYNVYMLDQDTNPLGVQVVDGKSLSEGAKIGVTLEGYDNRTEFKVTNSIAATQLKYFTYDVPEHYTLVHQDGAIQIAIAQVGDVYYGKVADAITAAGENMLTLQGDIRTDITATGNMLIDLNGHDMQKLTMPAGTQVSLVDTTTNDYDCSNGYGKVTVEGEYVPYVETNDGNLRRYVTIKDKTDDTVSAHRVYLAINAKVLRVANAGVGFKTIFAGDQVVQENLTHFGIKLYAEGYEDKAFTGYFTNFTAGRQAGDNTPNQKTAVIRDVLTTAANAETDAKTNIIGQPFMVVGGETVEGAEISTNLNDLAYNAINSSNEENKKATEAMLAPFSYTPTAPAA